MGHGEQPPGAEALAGRAVSAMDLAAYQAGAVVSRTILNKKTGNVTFFAFEEGQGLKEHTTPFDALVHVIDGEAEITIAGTPRTVAAGEMIVMPANEPHAVDARTRFKMILIMIRS
jgi:quercetin dioxygenase-like cupin family protein